MYFELSEKEFNGLESCQQQIGFMSDLCMHVEGAQSVSIVGLMHFLDAQKNALAKIIKIAEERQDEKLELNRVAATKSRYACSNGISPQLLADVLRMAVGEDLGVDGFQALNDQLATAMVNDSAYAVAIRPFYDLLVQRGYQITNEASTHANSSDAHHSANHLEPEKTGRKPVERSSRRRRDNLAKALETDKAAA